MAKKNIRIGNVTNASGSKRVILHVGGHRYITSTKVLANNGITNPFMLRGKTLGIEVYEVGEAMIDGTQYDQREESSLIKSITSVPEYNQAELIANAVGEAYLRHLLNSGAQYNGPQNQPEEKEDKIEENGDGNGAMGAGVDENVGVNQLAGAGVDENLPE